MGIITKLFGGEKEAPPPQNLDQFLAAYPDIAAKLEALDAEAAAKSSEQSSVVNGFVPIQSAIADIQTRISIGKNEKTDVSALERSLRIEQEALANSRTRATALTREGAASKGLGRDVRKFIVGQVIPAGGVVNRVAVALPSGKLEDIISDARRAQKVAQGEKADWLNRPAPKDVALASALDQLPIEQSPIRLRFDNKQRIRITWATEVVDAEPKYITQLHPPEVADAKSIAAWLAHEMLVDEVTKQIDGLYADDPPVATAAEKRAAIAKIDARILDAERLEAAALWESRKKGNEPIAWRADLDVRALLGIDGPVPHRPRD